MSGINSGTTSGGGAGGQSGAQTTVMIPAFMIPDTLYIQCGAGGAGPTVQGSIGNAGVATYVTIEPSTTLTANMTLLFANPGIATGGAVPNATNGGIANATAAAAATIANMPLAGRGFYNFLAGQIGSNGGANTTAGIAQTLPATGLMVTGGTGGGGCNVGTGFAGGIFNSVNGLALDIFPALAAGAAAVTSTPAGAGSSYIARNFQMNYGGTGGGGATTTSGGTAGAGATGAPGSGGGGGGGANTTNATVKGGDGGPGFVLIASW